MKLEEVESLTKEYIERYWGLPGVNKDKITPFVWTLQTWDFHKNLVEDRKARALKYLTQILPTFEGYEKEALLWDVTARFYNHTKTVVDVRNLPGEDFLEKIKFSVSVYGDDFAAAHQRINTKQPLLNFIETYLPYTKKRFFTDKTQKLVRDVGIIPGCVLYKLRPDVFVSKSTLWHAKSCWDHHFPDADDYPNIMEHPNYQGFVTMLESIPKPRVLKWEKPSISERDKLNCLPVSTARETLAHHLLYEDAHHPFLKDYMNALSLRDTLYFLEDVRAVNTHLRRGGDYCRHFDGILAYTIPWFGVTKDSTDTDKGLVLFFTLILWMILFRDLEQDTIKGRKPNPVAGLYTLMSSVQEPWELFEMPHTILLSLLKSVLAPQEQ